MSSQTHVSVIYEVPPSRLFITALAVGTAFIAVMNYSPLQGSLWITLLGMTTIMGTYIWLVVFNVVGDISKEQKADSCYYLGFILTLIAMVISLGKFQDVGADNFSSIVSNFGVALATTVIGLTARIIWLHLYADKLIDAEDAIRDRLVHEADNLQLQIERIISSFSGLAVSTESITEPLEKSLKSLEETFAAPEELSSSWTEVSKNIESLTNQLSKLNGVVTHITNELNGVLTTLNADAFLGINNRLEDLNTLLTNLNPELQNNLGTFNLNLQSSSRKIDDYNNSLVLLLKETKETYSEVSRSMRENAKYIRDELK